MLKCLLLVFKDENTILGISGLPFYISFFHKRNHQVVGSFKTQVGNLSCFLYTNRRFLKKTVQEFFAH